MSGTYKDHLRVPLYPGILDSDDFKALSSEAPSSSQEYPLPAAEFPPGPFHSLNFDEDKDDEQYEPNTSTQDRFKDNKKAVDVLTFMKSKYDQFTLHKLLAVIFELSASNKVKGFATSFKKDQDGVISLLEILYGFGGAPGEYVSAWVIKKVGQICDKEALRLTERASRGGLEDNVAFFQVTSKSITVEMVDSFHIPQLTACYDQVIPNLQSILRAVIAKDGVHQVVGSCDPDNVIYLLHPLRNSLYLLALLLVLNTDHFDDLQHMELQLQLPPGNECNASMASQHTETPGTVLQPTGILIILCIPNPSH